MSAAALIILLCALACPLSMILMMVFMRKDDRSMGHGRHREQREMDDEQTR